MWLKITYRLEFYYFYPFMLTITNLNSKPLLGGFALANINLQINPLEQIGIMGTTGVGKSTLLKTIAGFIQHDNGQIIFKNKTILGPDHQLIPGVDGIAYLSQHFELWNNYKMEDILSYKNELTKEESERLYHLCKITHLMKRNSKQLSGGEKQRIALAKLLVAKPSLLILDEPYSNLDLIHKQILKDVIASVCSSYKIACIMSSHDPNDILPWANKIIVMQDGKIIQEDEPENIFTHPKNEYVAGLLGLKNKVVPALKELLHTNKTFLNPWKINMKQNGVKAIVEGMKFYGHYYEIKLNINNETLFMNHYTSLETGAVIQVIAL
jgi:ABC-type sulfate/molybdate transport systems ATPase subunit